MDMVADCSLGRSRVHVSLIIVNNLNKKGGSGNEYEGNKSMATPI